MSDWIGPRTTLVIFVTAQAIVGYIMAGVYGYLLDPRYIAAFCVVYGVFLSLGEMVSLHHVFPLLSHLLI